MPTGRPGSDAGVRIALNRTVFFVGLTLVASLATAMVYGFGGVMAVNGQLTVGTLLAPRGAARRSRSAHRDVECPGRRHDRPGLLRAGLRDPRPAPSRRGSPERRPTAGWPGGGELRGDVHFSYPSADRVSLASLETTTVGDRSGGGAVLKGSPSSPSRASSLPSSVQAGPGRRRSPRWSRGSTTPARGGPRRGVDLRDAAAESVRRVVGWSPRRRTSSTTPSGRTCGAARASEEGAGRGLQAAQIWELVASPCPGLDTVVGDHPGTGSPAGGLAPGDRAAAAQAPSVIIPDGPPRTWTRSPGGGPAGPGDHVRADGPGHRHRLSTVRGADQILVIPTTAGSSGGGQHEELSPPESSTDLYTRSSPPAQAATDVWAGSHRPVTGSPPRLSHQVGRGPRDQLPTRPPRPRSGPSSGGPALG